MTLSEIKTQLSSSGLPVAYQAFPADEDVQMPFVVFQEVGSDNFGADGVVYAKAKRIQVDLFTHGKDSVSEESLEAALNFCFWNNEQTPIDDESCNRMTYTFVV